MLRTADVLLGVCGRAETIAPIFLRECHKQRHVCSVPYPFYRSNLRMALAAKKGKERTRDIENGRASFFEMCATIERMNTVL